MAINDLNKTGPDFWCNLSAESIYNSPERRAKSVDSLKTVILWAFALFSVGGFVINLFGELRNFSSLSLIAFGLAFFMLTISYYLAGEAQYPVMKQFVQDDPSSITDAFNAAAEVQSRLFKRAATVTGMGFFFLAVGILIQFGTLKKEEAKRSGIVTQPLIKTGIEKRADSVFVPVTIHWKKNDPIRLSFLKSDGPGFTETLLSDQTFYADPDGRVFHSRLFLPSDSVKNLIVRAEAFNTSSDTAFRRITSVKLTLSP